MSTPDFPDRTLAANVAERWRQVGEQTELPGMYREALAGMLAADGGTTAETVAEALRVPSWTARAYLERLRFEGTARVESTGDAFRWLREGARQ
jgi:predicted ArsR family transcriptional regulator